MIITSNLALSCKAEQNFLPEMFLAENTITNEELELLNKIYDFILNVEITEEGHNQYSYSTQKDWSTFFKSLNITKESNFLTHLAHFLVLLLPPKVTVKNNKSKKTEQSKKNFKEIIIEIIEILFESKQINPNQTLDNGQNFIGTMLSHYDRNSYPTYGDYDIKLIELAIKYGLDINHQDEKGDTILNIAITNPKIRHKDRYGSHLESLVSCIANDFNFNLENHDGLAFVDIMYEMQQKDPIAIYKVRDQRWHLFDSFYIDNILDIIKSKYGQDCVAALTKEKIEKKLNELYPLINRLKTFLNQPASSHETTSLRRLYENTSIEHTSLVTTTKTMLEQCFPGYGNEVFEFVVFGKVTVNVLNIFEIILNFKELNGMDKVNILNNRQVSSTTTIEFLLKFTSAFYKYANPQIVGSTITKELSPQA